MIYDPRHLQKMLADSGETLWLSDTQGLEAVHSALRKSDERHANNVTNEIGT